MTNCPNCGAPVTSYKCEYCGTVFERLMEAEYLKSKTEELKQSLYVKSLYAEAIKAMRNYGSLTTNEC